MTAPRAAVAAAAAILRTMSSPEWAVRTGDPDAQGDLLLEALCEELHPLGSVAFPSVGHLRQCANRRFRDADVRDAFDGRNYEALARRHRLSTRQIRRIVDEPRKAQTRGT